VGYRERNGQLILSDADIRRNVEKGEIGIEPYDPERQQPASYDLLLGKQLLRYKLYKNGWLFNPLTDTADMEDSPFHGGTFKLSPGSFALGATQERVRVPRWAVGRLEGKSSLARLGLLVHSTAGFLDPGFEGTITLELFNLSPRTLVLTPGMKIAHLSFDRLSSPAERPYGTPGLGSRYQGQTRPTASRYNEEHD